LDYNMTRQASLAEMEPWQFHVPAAEAEASQADACVDPDRPVLRARLRPSTSDHSSHGGAKPRIASPDATRHQ